MDPNSKYYAAYQALCRGVDAKGQFNTPWRDWDTVDMCNFFAEALETDEIQEKASDLSAHLAKCKNKRKEVIVMWLKANVKEYKKSLIVILILIFSTLTSFSQSTRPSVKYVEQQGIGLLQLNVKAGQTIDYWARKGLSSKPLLEEKNTIIQAMQNRINLADKQIIEYQNYRLTTDKYISELKTTSILRTNRIEELENMNAEQAVHIAGLEQDVKKWKSKASVLGKFKTVAYTLVGVLVAATVYTVASGN